MYIIYQKSSDENESIITEEFRTVYKSLANVVFAWYKNHFPELNIILKHEKIDLYF